MTFNVISPGIQVIGTFGPFQDKVRIFLLQHGSDCVVVELPPTHDNKKPWSQLKKYIKAKNLKLKFITASHGHWDHFYIFPEFHQEFPDVPIIVSSKFFEEEINEFITPKDLMQSKLKEPSLIKKKTPIYCFKGRTFETHLSGEPLYLFSTPKHSWGDISIIFRGSMVSGDWWLGPGDPNPNKIPTKEINQSLDFLINFSISNNYNIHTLIAVHDNDFRSNVNFIDLMEKTRP